MKRLTVQYADVDVSDNNGNGIGKVREVSLLAEDITGDDLYRASAAMPDDAVVLGISIMDDEARLK